MFLPHTYETGLLFMLATMLCWGSWANTMKLCPGYRFQLFYWDYVLGLLAGILLLGVTMGSNGDAGLPFFQHVMAASRNSLIYAALGGVVFNIANLLLVAAIEIAGLAVAFPVGIGLALVIGAVSNYIITPQGNPLLLFGGMALVVVAIICDALAYREREARREGSTRAAWRSA